ncbi:hypothetical protein TUM4644_33330 [Shewanella colwelliana]|uniref:hypothetical protein n=1 Tax=Shewanella colwelliana TaxID=23 RepID=UPI001BC55277|nr:hypothetical protein [Shewanella colwelliana]GIU32913.1 hypothetical protein TUM4644_33330 [Shewanella colwelliana]
MNINLSKAHVLTTRDNKKLYEVKEILRLHALYEQTKLGSLLTTELVSEQEYRAALSALVKPLKTKVAKERKCYANRKAIINGHTQTAYILPVGHVFSTHSHYSTFSHDKLSQLKQEQQQVIKAGLRPTDILRLETIHKASQQYYQVIEL